jgi:hypothetical protein
MLTHTDLLNLIAETIGAETYLEIGVHNPDHNFNHIKVLWKTGVDPDPAAQAKFQWTSDEFFKFFPTQKNYFEKYDLIFIDGLHHADQVKKDIDNAWQYLSDGGVIVIHDTNPQTEATTCVPRGEQREWCGDVYKTICALDIPFFTVDFDYGCTVIRKLSNKNISWREETITKIHWDYFDLNRHILLNLTGLTHSCDVIRSFLKIKRYANQQ